MNMRTMAGISRRACATVVGVSLVFLIGACGQNDESVGEDGEKIRVVKIGHAGPLTGPVAHLGKDNENGVRLAIQEANAASLVIAGENIRFEMVSEDDEANPQKGTVVAQKLVDEQVAGGFGDFGAAIVGVFFDEVSDVVADQVQDALVRGEIDGVRLFKMALTVLVPYTVSTLSSVQAMRAQAPQSSGSGNGT